MQAKVWTKESRRDQVLRCAKAVFASRGYHAASVADIIAEAGIARGTFYLYFSGKREIFDAILDGLLEELDRRVTVIEVGPSAPPPLDQLHANLKQLLSLVLQDPDLVTIVLFQAAGLDQDCRDRLDDFYKGVLEKLKSALRKGMMVGLVRPCDTDIAAAAILGAIQSVIAQAARQEGSQDIEHLADEILAFGLLGILAARAGQPDQDATLTQISRRLEG